MRKEVTVKPFVSGDPSNLGSLSCEICLSKSSSTLHKAIFEVGADDQVFALYTAKFSYLWVCELHLAEAVKMGLEWEEVAT